MWYVGITKPGPGCVGGCIGGVKPCIQYRKSQYRQISVGIERRTPYLPTKHSLFNVNKLYSHDFLLPTMNKQGVTERRTVEVWHGCRRVDRQTRRLPIGSPTRRHQHWDE
jgi:hypothetical protein